MPAMQDTEFTFKPKLALLLIVPLAMVFLPTTAVVVTGMMGDVVTLRWPDETHPFPEGPADSARKSLDNGASQRPRSSISISIVVICPRWSDCGCASTTRSVNGASTVRLHRASHRLAHFGMR